MNLKLSRKEKRYVMGLLNLYLKNIEERDIMAENILERLKNG